MPVINVTYCGQGSPFSYQTRRLSRQVRFIWAELSHSGVAYQPHFTFGLQLLYRLENDIRVPQPPVTERQARRHVFQSYAQNVTRVHARSLDPRGSHNRYE